MTRLLTLLTVIFICLVARADDTPLKSVATDKKLVALTFDDGPHEKNTQRLLDIFAREHVKVTFFEVGRNVVKYPEIERAIFAAGHEIGNHSRTHPYLNKVDVAAIRAEIVDTQAAIKSATGFTPVLFRAPFLAHSPDVWTVLHELNLPSIGAVISTADWDAKTTREQIIDRCAQAKPGAIILMHSWPDKTVEAMPEIIRQFKEKGFTFVTVSELIAAGAR